MPQAIERNGFNQQSNAARSGRKTATISAMTGGSSLNSLMAAASVVPMVSVDVPCEHANDDSDQNHIDRNGQFGNQGKIGGDCDARKKGAILHGEDPDQLGEASRRAIREYAPIRIPASPMGRFTWITGSDVVASRGLTEKLRRDGQQQRQQ